MNLFEFQEELERARELNCNRDFFGVEFHLNKENATHVYVAFRNEQEFSSWKDSLKDWDVIINRLAI